ncbi:hypothetical protein [Flavobacterium sp. XGLA_31]|uniref:hypothetical protein n=1 Tax=Flavobacterium sp. XGLA_31 TaxID=3447666 RepID=UPI003F37654A
MKTTAYLKMIFLSGFLILALPASANTATNANPTEPTVTTTAAEKARAEQLLHRLDEIKAMDKSDMPRAEKKALRKEVKAIKGELRTMGGGVYLSVGAIIIIILLLILLL